jgi:uncharacterized membrane protein YbjE (DUF340 family)
MKTLIRNVLAAVLGVLIGGAVNMALIMAGPAVIAPPAGVDMSNADSIAASIHLFRPHHLLFPFLAHALGTLAGALAAFLIAASHKTAFAYGVGLFFLAGGIAATFMIPAPAWFVALDLVAAYIPMAWLGARLGRRFGGNAAQ